MLIAQSYSKGWADRFYEDILPALSDPRYIAVNGRPLLVLYRIGHIENAAAAIERWKERAQDDGLGGLHVLAVSHSRHFEGLPRGVENVIDGLVAVSSAGRHRTPVGREPGPRDVPDIQR